MGKVIAIEHLTLDGVMQAPGHADEDPRDGFSHGGWAAKRGQDPKMQQFMGEHMSSTWSLLLGRTTYQRFADFWPRQPSNPFTKILNEVTKYVASRTLTESLPWQNSILLKGDAEAAVRRLKGDRAENLVIFGSGVLVRSLMTHGLVDELVLMIHPLALGSGRRLFAGSGSPPVGFDLETSSVTTTGVILTAYKPAPFSG